MLRLFYTLHKWLAIGIGLVLLMWIVTGIVMGSLSDRMLENAPAQAVDYSRVTLSPSQVLQRLSGHAGGPVTGLDVVQFGSRALYQARFADKSSAFLDASDGSEVVITAALARTMAEAAAGRPAPADAIEVRAHDADYPSGALPIFRLIYGDDKKTSVDVSPRTAEVRVNDSRRRMRRMVGSLHTFGSLRALVRSPTTVHQIFIFASVVSLLVVLTGYVLALPRRRRRRIADRRVSGKV
ncbi:MAG: PepSY domain-containing protein [Gemmatimonadota bacterium]